MGRLDTNRLMRECRKIAAKQKEEAQKSEAVEPTSAFAEQLAKLGVETFVCSTPSEPEVELLKDRLDAATMEQYLTEFTEIMRESSSRYEDAVEAEQFPNAATQDIMHALEFAPSCVDFDAIVPTLRTLRTSRRTAKTELEVTKLVNDWAKDNAKALNQLNEVLGKVRRILKNQPTYHYNWKTSIIGEKGSSLIPDPVDNEENPE